MIWQRVKKKKGSGGFSLVEILVAITFLGIGLIGVIAFFNSSLVNQADAKKNLIASNLAQEGTELVRNMADNEKLSKTSWSTVISNLSGSGRKVDYRSLTSHGFQTSSSAEVCLVGGRYKQCDSGETQIGMQRTVTIIDQGANGLNVTSTVIYSGRTITATDRLYQNNF